MTKKNKMCPACGGDNAKMPCAFPGRYESQNGCIKRTHPSLGDKRVVFAWWPVPRIVKDAHWAGDFFKRDGWYWLRKVEVTWTFNGWVAYGYGACKE